MYSRVLAMALCAGFMMPSGTVYGDVKVTSETSPFVVLGIFAGACFMLYKGATTYERYCSHSRAIKRINDARIDSCLNADDLVSYAKKKYKTSSHPLVCVYTHLTKIRENLEQSSIDLTKDAMVSSYNDCADLYEEARGLIKQINSVLPNIEDATGFKDQLDRYMLSTVPGMVDSINDLKDEIRRHRCDCH